MLSSDARKVRAGWVEVPLCVTALPGEAVERLKAAGLAVDPVLALVVGSPVRGISAGRVTTTQPPYGAVIDPQTVVSVFVNPGEPGTVCGD